MALLRSIKNSLLPSDVKRRRVPFGLARGVYSIIDFKLDASFYYGRHERELYPFYRRFVMPGIRCFDIGCYRGWDALIFSKLNNNSGVIAFESNKKSYEHIEAVIDCSGFDIQLVRKYVSNTITNGNTTIDDISKKYYCPEFIKMDIEGAEAIALQGACGILRERKTNWVIEVHGQEVEEECYKILEKHRYRIQVVEQKSYLGKESRGNIHNRWLVAIV